MELCIIYIYGVIVLRVIIFGIIIRFGASLRLWHFEIRSGSLGFWALRLRNFELRVAWRRRFRLYTFIEFKVILNFEYSTSQS